MKQKSAIFLTFLSILVLQCVSFKELHDLNDIMIHYEQTSSKPLIHAFYNRHFKNSTQFKEFQSLIQQIYDDHGDYMDILYTDCDKDLQLKISYCKNMNRTKDNRQIVGTMPSSSFRRLGDKIIQNPPSSQILEHKKDVYQYSQLKQFIFSLLPNFYKQINNLQQYEDFLQPKYSPKLIAFVTEDQPFPMVLKQIAVAFFLKLDFAYITDLTEQPLALFKTKQFPSFAIVKYNFNESKHQTFFYTKTELTQENYYTIKQFVTKYALTQPRNDLLFHKITMEKNCEILTAQNQGQLQQLKQKANGWVIIGRSDGKIPQKLIDLKQKYERYFSYINYVNQPVGKLQLYNPTQNMTFPFAGADLQFNSLDYQDFRSNMTIWLSKDMVVLGVSEDYAHICGLAQKVMFRGFVRCLIISNQHKKQLQEFMKIEFKVGFISRTESSQKSSQESPTRETKGVKIQKDIFQQIYRDLDFNVRSKIKQSLDEYMHRPVTQPRDGVKIEQACFHPFKKCLFLLTNLAKQDRTFQQYLKQIGFDYMDNFIMYELDIDNNPDFVKAIGGTKDKKADIVIFNPRTRQYTRLNKNVTKNLISQFMKANLKNDKRLKKHKSEQFHQITLNRRSRTRAAEQVPTQEQL